MKIGPALLVVSLLNAAPVLAQTTTSAPADHVPSDHAQTGHAASQPDTYTNTLNQRISHMHQRLRITAAQDSAWNGFAQTMRDNAEAVRQDYEKRAEGMKSMSAAENLQDYAQIEQDRAQGVQKLAASFGTLYQSLSDEQKKTADTMFRQYDLNHQKSPRHTRANAG